MTLPEVNRLYPTDDRCRELLERLRWPEGVMCPRCKDSRVSRMRDYARFECVGCEYQFTVTSGTIFHDTHLPLPIWFLAVLLICEAKKGMSAMQLKRTLWGEHRGSYKTAWYLCQRIRAAMASAEKVMLDGTVEMDETWVGGRERNPKGAGRIPYAESKKVPVVGIKQRGGELRFSGEVHQRERQRRCRRDYDRRLERISRCDAKGWSQRSEAQEREPQRKGLR
jgi:transposase-like protein